MKRKTKKEPEEVKSRDGVIRRNLDRIRVSAATPLPSDPSRCSEVTAKISARIHFSFEIDNEREEWRDEREEKAELE